QNLRRQNIHSLPPNMHYSENQSINDKLENIQDIKNLITKAQQAIEELLLNTLTPTESETLFNAIHQLQRLNDWQLKLTKLNDIANASNDTETITLVKEVTVLNRHQNTQPTHSGPPLQSMLLIIMVMLTLLKNTLRKQN
ncbi:MAG: hypothetical protein ACPGVP_20845, partial [Thiolinea sp.]